MSPDSAPPSRRLSSRWEHATALILRGVRRDVGAPRHSEAIVPGMPGSRTWDRSTRIRPVCPPSLSPTSAAWNAGADPRDRFGSPGGEFQPCRLHGVPRCMQRPLSHRSHAPPRCRQPSREGGRLLLPSYPSTKKGLGGQPSPAHPGVLPPRPLPASLAFTRRRDAVAPLTPVGVTAEGASQCTRHADLRLRLQFNP